MSYVTVRVEPFTIELAAKSDAGAAIGQPQDYSGKLVQGQTGGVVAIADGKGSPEGGGLASRRAVLALLQAYRELPSGTGQTQRMTRAARAANYEVYDLASTVPRLRAVRVTLTAASVRGGHLAAAHIGDGRLYLVRAGAITQLSKDHTVAAEAAEQSVPMPAAGGERVTRSLGSELLVPFDFFEIDLQKDDVVLLCSEALHRGLRDEAIAAAARQGDASYMSRNLIAAANREGTTDGVSVAVIRILGDTG